MAAYWRSKRERKNFSGSLSRFLFVAFCQKRGNERKRSFAWIYLTRLLLLKENERRGERERTIHAHTFRITHDKPCAAIEGGYYTNPVLIFLSKENFFLLFSIVLPSVEKKRKRDWEREREKRKNGSERRRQAHWVSKRLYCIEFISSTWRFLIINKYTYTHTPGKVLPFIQ
jgi:hypothetical protein